MKKAILVVLLVVFSVPLTVDTLGQASKRKKRTTEADFKRRVESPCGVRQSFDDWLEEIQVEWRLASTTTDEEYYYNTKKMLCERGILKVWIKKVAKSTKDTADVSPYSIQRLELKCPHNQTRVVSTTAYAKNGSVLLSNRFSNAEWEDAIPDSVAENVLETICHKS